MTTLTPTEQLVFDLERVHAAERQDLEHELDLSNVLSTKLYKAIEFQQELIDGAAVQCGFCIPGMIMQASVLLRRMPSPTEEQVRAAITVICRCGVYPRLRDAIQRAARVMRGEARLSIAPPPGITPEDAAAAVPALRVKKD